MPHWVTVTHKKEAFGLSFDVIDAGPGSAPVRQEAIFELFCQGHDITTTAGKGMGLTVAKALSECLSGRLVLRGDHQNTCFELIVR